MALESKVINGTLVEYDTAVRDELVELIKSSLPDGGSGDINLLDYAAVLAGVLLRAATKNVGDDVGRVVNAYYVSHQDIINDADNDGFIMFNDKTLNGKKTKVDENTYDDANFTYSLDGNNLIVVDKNLGEYITIENFQDGAMGINLDKEDENANEPILIKISNLTCQDTSWYVAQNNMDFKFKKEAA